MRKLQNLTVALEQKMLHEVAKGHHWELPEELVPAQQVHLMAPISGAEWVGEAWLVAEPEAIVLMFQILWLSVIERTPFDINLYN